MRNSLLYIVLSIAGTVYFGSCSENVDFNPTIYDTDTPYLSDVDRWIRENYIEVFNIEFVYKRSGI